MSSVSLVLQRRLLDKRLFYRYPESNCLAYFQCYHILILQE
jgi:hypothetical protein